MRQMNSCSATGVVAIALLSLMVSGCQSLVEEAAYRHSDEKQQGMSQTDYDFQARQRQADQQEEESEFNRMQNQ